MQRLQPEEIESQLFPLVRRGYDTDKVDAFLRVVTAYYREALRAADEQQHAPASYPQGFDAIGGQIASILATASSAAEDLKIEANHEAQLMRRVAAEESAEMTLAATNQLAMARQLKADALQEAEAIRSEASDEAARLRREARERIVSFEGDARARIMTLEETAKANVEAFLEEARRRYGELRDAERQSVAHLGSVQTTIRKAREALSADYATMHLGDLIGHARDDQDRNETPTASRQMLVIPPVGLARMRWPDNGAANSPPPPRST
jgi:DivIVA domain-containing protein